MTLIAGWKTNNAVFIAGDSAITYPKNTLGNLDSFTSFTEKIVNQKDQVIDNSLKVEIIAKKIIIASAGKDYLCKNFINDLNRKISLLNSDIVTLINDTLNEYGNTDEIALIFGFMHEGEACLFSYNDRETNATQLNKISSFTYAGSIDETVLHLIKETSIFAKSINFDESKTLISLCSILQSFVLRHPQLENGIGGFFAGAYLKDYSLNWVDDTTFLIYDQQFPSKSSGINISVAIRDNGAFIYTPQFEVNNKIFFSTHTDNPLQEFQSWFEKYYYETNKKVNSSDSKYLVFLHSSLPIVTVTTFEYKEYIKVISSDKLRKEFQISPECLKKLFTEILPPISEMSDVYPFTFHFGW